MVGKRRRAVGRKVDVVARIDARIVLGLDGIGRKIHHRHNPVTLHLTHQNHQAILGIVADVVHRPTLFARLQGRIVMFEGNQTAVEGGGCNSACDSSLLEGNPIHEDMTEACAMLEPDFLLNTVFTPDGAVSEIVAGHWYEAWEKGCQDLLKMAGVKIKELADVVIASAGGYPKDLNLHQSIKCHMNATFAVKRGGIMIFTLDCEDIKEPAIFTDCFSRSNLEQFEKDIREAFTVPAFVAFKGRNIIKDVTAYIVTRPENFDFVKRTGHIPCTSLEEAWKLAQGKLAEQGKKDYTITIMGHASATLPILEK